MVGVISILARSSLLGWSWINWGQLITGNINSSVMKPLDTSDELTNSAAFFIASMLRLFCIWKAKVFVMNVDSVCRYDGVIP